MRLIISPIAMAIVRLPADAPIPEWASGGPLVSITRTSEEMSVVCPTSCLPDDLPGPVEGPLVAIRVADAMEFSQVGVLVSLLRPLADAGIPILTVSTFETDWILVPAPRIAAAASVWRGAGHGVTEGVPVTPQVNS